MKLRKESKYTHNENAVTTGKEEQCSSAPCLHLKEVEEP